MAIEQCGRARRSWRRRLHGAVVAALRSPPPVSLGPLAEARATGNPLSAAYDWLVARKRSRDTARAVRISPPDVPVLSVGNVTFGATGKTPCVLLLVELALKLSRNNRVPMLLSRGYGDDEWRMLAAKFPACELAIGSDRAAVGARRVAECGGGASLSCVVVDDGLQQWSIPRDLELVMMDALHPVGNGRLLPCGSLRERPSDALARADVVVLHHAELVPHETLARLETAVAKWLDPARKPIIATSRVKLLGLPLYRDVLGTTLSTDDDWESSCSGRVALIVCGVGNPESVRLVVEKSLSTWLHVEMAAYPDHHSFSHMDMVDVQRLCAQLRHRWGQEVVVLTTEKDLSRSPVELQTLADTEELRVIRAEMELDCNAEAVVARVAALLDHRSSS